MKKKHKMRRGDKLGETRFTSWPDMNFCMQLGEDTGSMSFNMNVKKTWLNRIKYWLFFQFFPFKLVKWTELEEPKE